MRRWRVLVPGAISPVKGLDLLQSCLEDASARDLPLHFVVLGYVGRPLPQWPDTPLTIAGEYREGMLARFIAAQGGDVVLFPVQCPETFLYTLSTALDSGLPIVATELGAFVDRLAGRKGATLLPWNASASQVNDALLAAVQGESAPDPNIEPVARMTFDAYRQRYLDGLGRGAPERGQVEVDPGWLQEPPRERAVHPISFLFQDGVDCGRTGSLEQLRRYAFDPDAMHADADARFMELIQTLGEERRASGERIAQATALEERSGSEARQRLERLEASASWRITAPLRRLARWVRGGR